jgi:hypothetical protein
MPQLSSPTLRVMLALALAVPAWLQAEDAAKSRARRRATPIRDSLDRIIDEVVASHLEPCSQATRKGVPCFPVSVEQQGPHYSVAEAFRNYRPTGKPAPSVPTVADTQSHLSGAPLSASGGIPFNPGCTTKNLWKKIRGRNNTYHLYRTWDAQGERPLLTDHLLDPEDFAGKIEFHYEYLGQFDGECEAVAAWRKALREAVEPKPVAPDQ